MAAEAFRFLRKPRTPASPTTVPNRDRADGNGVGEAVAIIKGDELYV